jgi:hypothetical protein
MPLSLPTDVWPFFNMAKPFKNPRTTNGILSESDFNHTVGFYAIVPQFLPEIHEQSLFRLLGHSEPDDNSKPSCSLSGIT